MQEDNYNTLADQCNQVMMYLNSLPPEEQIMWVNNVLDWLSSMYRKIQVMLEEAQRGRMGKIRLMKELNDIKNKYAPIIEEKRPEIIVALTYAIKPEFQEKLAPMVYAVLGLI